MSNASGDPVKGGHEANWTTTAIPDVCWKICDSSVFNRAELQNLPPASQMLLGNLSELKGKLWRMGRQKPDREIPEKHGKDSYIPFSTQFHVLSFSKNLSPLSIKQEESLFKTPVQKETGPLSLPSPSCTYATTEQIIWRDFLTVSYSAAARKACLLPSPFIQLPSADLTSP